MYLLNLKLISIFALPKKINFKKKEVQNDYYSCKRRRKY